MQEEQSTTCPLMQVESSNPQLASIGKAEKERFLPRQTEKQKVPEIIVLVDERDNPIGYEEKLAAHRDGGKLHRAFSIFIFNSHRPYNV